MNLIWWWWAQIKAWRQMSLISSRKSHLQAIIDCPWLGLRPHSVKATAWVVVRSTVLEFWPKTFSYLSNVFSFVLLVLFAQCLCRVLVKIVLCYTHEHLYFEMYFWTDAALDFLGMMSGLGFFGFFLSFVCFGSFSSRAKYIAAASAVISTI